MPIPIKYVHVRSIESYEAAVISLTNGEMKKFE